MENRTRDQRFLVSLTEREMDRLMRNVKKTGLTRDAYVRTLISGIQPRELPSPDFVEVLKVLHQISSNMNQIALKANQTGDIYAKEYWENSMRLREAISAIKQSILSQ